MVQNLVVDQLLQREAHLHRSIIPTLILLNFPSTRWTLCQQCSPSLSFICLWYKILLHMNRVFQLYRLDQVAKSQVVHHSIIHAFNIKLCYTQLSFANTNYIKLQNPNLYKFFKTWSYSRLIPSGSWKREMEGVGFPTFVTSLELNSDWSNN